jgi:hypothetical protein
MSEAHTAIRQHAIQFAPEPGAYSFHARGIEIGEDQAEGATVASVPCTMRSSMVASSEPRNPQGRWVGVWAGAPAPATR